MMKKIEGWRANSHGAHWCPQMPTGCDRWNPLFVRGAHDSPDTHHKLHILLHSPIYNIKYKYIYVFLSGYRGYLFIFTLNYIKMRKWKTLILCVLQGFFIQKNTYKKNAHSTQKIGFFGGYLVGIGGLSILKIL